MAATGIELLFDACVTRFNAKTDLKAVGRKLSMVFQSTKPWTQWERVGFGTDDTFVDDIEIHTVRFTFFGKYPTIRKAATWLEKMTDAFDDYTGLSVTGYTTSGVDRMDGDDGPFLVDGVWEASATYRITLHRDALLPAVRGS